MVFISEELIRKKSEHNELVISTLEELSLHQENIEKLDHLQNWCKDLKILLLQSNLIPRIENLFKLKKLEYLNLAINNIERVENLEALESLQKLDLTLNFIGDLTSIETLRANYNLRELHLTGNPCTDYPEYRAFVVASLPQLCSLDGQPVTRTDQLRALSCLHENRRKVVQRQAEYQIQRDQQKVRVQTELEEAERELKGVEDEEERTRRFWNRKSENCPETRCQIAQHAANKRKSNNGSGQLDGHESPKPPILFAPCGRPYNLNKARLEFSISDEPDQYELDLHIYKFLDTSLIDVDVEPTYVRVTVKGKIFQLALNDEISVEKSTTQRSVITGNLRINMPKLLRVCGGDEEVVVVPAREAERGANELRNDEPSSKSDAVEYKNIVKHDDFMDLPELV